MTSGTSGVYISPIPEPAGAAVVCSAVMGLFSLRRKRSTAR
jgi:hypothetical protein